MRRPPFSAVRLSLRFRLIMGRIAPYAAAASAGLILWHAVSDSPRANLSAAAPLVYPTRTVAPPAPAPTPAAGTGLGAQQAGLASTIQVVVGPRDTSGRFSSAWPSIRPISLPSASCPGIRQSLDYLKPGDAIQVTHREGSVKELTAR